MTVYDSVLHGLETDANRARHLAGLLRAAERYYSFVVDSNTVGMATPVPVDVALARIAACTANLARVDQRLVSLQTRIRMLRYVQPEMVAAPGNRRPSTRPRPHANPAVAKRAPLSRANPL